MGLLDIFKKEENPVEFPYSIKATASGEIVAMKDIPDAVFANGMVGPCIGIEPNNGTIVAPCDGKILQLSDTLHAFGIQGKAGEQILVHIGIDTVSMNGDGFSAKVKVGDSVKAGQPIVEMDIDKVKAAGLICTQNTGHNHIIFKRNTWMLPCILQEASILFLIEFFCYYNNLCILPLLP